MILVVRDNNYQEQWKQQNLQFYKLFTVFCSPEGFEKLLNITWFLWFFGVGFGTSSSNGFWERFSSDFGVHVEPKLRQVGHQVGLQGLLKTTSKKC